MENSEWVTIEALLKKGEYPVITDLLKFGQDVNMAIFALMKVKAHIDGAVAKHTELKIEKRICERRNNIEHRREDDKK